MVFIFWNIVFWSAFGLLFYAIRKGYIKVDTSKPLKYIFAILTLNLFFISIYFFDKAHDANTFLVGAGLFSVAVLFTSLGIIITILLQQLSETKKLTKLLEKKEKIKPK